MITCKGAGLCDYDGSECTATDNCGEYEPIYKGVHMIRLEFDIVNGIEIVDFFDDETLIHETYPDNATDRDIINFFLGNEFIGLNGIEVTEKQFNVIFSEFGLHK